MGNQDFTAGGIRSPAQQSALLRPGTLAIAAWIAFASGFPLALAAVGVRAIVAGAIWFVVMGWASWQIGERAVRRSRALQKVGTALERMDPSPIAVSGVDGDVRDFLARWNGLAPEIFRTRTDALRLIDLAVSLPEASDAAFDDVQSMAGKREAAIEEAASLVANMGQSVRGIEDSVGRLSASAEGSTSAVIAMGSSIEEIAGNTSSLHDAVDASTTAVHQMGASIRQVSTGAEHVLEMAESTASAVVEMDRSVQEVSTNAVEAASLTEEAHAGAGLGAEAVQATIEDIERISALTSYAKERLSGLVSGISRIGNVLAAIDEINDETNLLSLNAAIIAAQAGEQGKAFRVVANHVKTLARRTSASTKDIEKLISDIEAESGEAERAMEAGIEAVDASVERSRDAGKALGSIQDSCKNASERVTEIARATSEQSRNSRSVAESTQKTSQEIQQISLALLEQRRASESMLTSAEGALERCQRVHSSTGEQRQTSRQITQAMSEITAMIHAISEQTRAHAVASESVSESVICLLDQAQAKGDDGLRPLRVILDQIESEAQRISSAPARKM